jgi:signal peptidase I
MLARQHPRLAGLLEFVALIAIALLLLDGVQATLIKPFRVPTASMEPTLQIGQRVLVNRFIYDLHAPQRGDIIVFHAAGLLRCVHPPAGETCPSAANAYVVKRIVGLPGERISIRNGHPVINGKDLAREPYITPCSHRPLCNISRAITIPPDHYYVLGDNRPESLDSRSFGPIRASAIVGQVIFTYWPPDRIGTP